MIPASDLLKFTMPEVNYSAIAPLLIVFGAAVLSVLVEAFVPRRGRRPVQLVLVIVTILVALGVTVSLSGTRLLTADGSIAVDGPTLLLWGALLVVALLGALLMAERTLDPLGELPLVL